MPTYKWKAKTRQGVLKSGELVADTKDEAMNTLADSVFKELS